MALAPITEDELRAAWPDGRPCGSGCVLIGLGITSRPQHLHNNNCARIIYQPYRDERNGITHFDCRVELHLGGGFYTDIWMVKQERQPDLKADRFAIAARFKDLFLPLLEPQEKPKWL